MRVDIRGRGIDVSGRLRNHIERRIYFAFSRFADRIARLSVSLRVERCSKHGSQMVCRIRVALRGGRHAIVQHADVTFEAAVDMVCDRARRRVARELEVARYFPSRGITWPASSASRSRTVERSKA